MKNYLLTFVFAFGTVATFMSCSKDMTSLSYEEVQKQTYSANFVAKYGDISPNQSWDFTTGERQLATRGVTTIKTQVMENGINFGDLSNLKVTLKNAGWNHSEFEGRIDPNKPSVEKNEKLLTAISSVLPEKKTWKGEPAVLVAPQVAFISIPSSVVDV